MPKRPLTILSPSVIFTSLVMVLLVAAQAHSAPGPGADTFSGKSKISGHQPAAQQPGQAGSPLQQSSPLVQQAAIL